MSNGGIGLMPNADDSSAARAIGLWRRVVDAVDDGPEDRSTAVFWGQTASRYIDVRIPAGRPRCGAADLRGLSEADLAVFGRQQGFAGDLAVAGDRFTWHRDMDLQPPSGRPDTGLVRIEGALLHEQGEAALPGSVYRETFERIASGARRRVALRAAAWPGHPTGAGAPVPAELVVIDDHFLFARARPAPLAVAPALGPLLAEARRAAPDRITDLLDCEFAKGRLDGEAGRWTVEVSTLPWREGRPAFPPGRARLDDDVLTVETPAGDVRWAVADSSVPASELLRLFGDGPP